MKYIDKQLDQRFARLDELVKRVTHLEDALRERGGGEKRDEDVREEYSVDSDASTVSPVKRKLPDNAFDTTDSPPPAKLREFYVTQIEFIKCFEPYSSSSYGSLVCSKVVKKDQLS